MGDSPRSSIFPARRRRLLEQRVSNLLGGRHRAQALADGVLVDLTRWSAPLDIRGPVACTAAVWADIAAIPAECAASEGTTSRVNDMLTMAALTARNDGLKVLTPSHMRYRAGHGFSWRFLWGRMRRWVRLRQVGSVDFYPMLSNDQKRVLTYQLVSISDQRGHIAITIFKPEEASRP